MKDLFIKELKELKELKDLKDLKDLFIKELFKSYFKELFI